MSGLRKRSLAIAGHRTSVSLEEPFWEALKEIAAAENMSPEAQAAMMYRCMADYTSDPRLAEMLRSMSQDEVRHYKQFQLLLERYDPLERPGLYRKGRTILERSALVRTRDLALVFDRLRPCCA